MLPAVDGRRSVMIEWLDGGIAARIREARKQYPADKYDLVCDDFGSVVGATPKPARRKHRRSIVVQTGADRSSTSLSATAGGSSPKAS